MHGQSYPGLVPAEGKATAGVLWEGIEPSDFALLDRYESDLYERRNVNVVPQGASPARTASVYLLPDRHREFLSNEAWDPERFARQHLVETVAHCERFRRSLSVTGVS